MKKATVVLCLLLFSTMGFAETMSYIYHRPESATDVRYNYQWELLKKALDMTKDNYGDYTLKPTKIVMNEKRQLQELMTNTGSMTIMIRAADKELEKKLTPVRIPLDKGLIGYRVFLINKKDQNKFTNIKTIEELKKLTVGQGLGWGDVKVWRANGFKVEEGSTYEGLFGMLMGGRFDFFSRGILEIILEYESRKAAMPELAIEDTICVYYPWPFYFYFAKSPEGKKLAARAEEGLLKLFDNKEEFNKIFLKYHGEAIKRHNLKNRKIFRLENPLLSPETPLKNEKLWYDPLKD